MTRIFNFSPGPATLPLSVLKIVQSELLDYKKTGISMLEHSHRGAAYTAVHAEAKVLLRELLSIPDSHEVLFMQGGARGQFGFIPMNLLGDASADYVDTGVWSDKALAEANRIGTARVAASGKRDGKYVCIPKTFDADDNAAYIHITTNNTVMGSQFQEIPKFSSPLIADMSSDILSKPIDVSQFGVIYAGAQKNLGPAGVTVLIIHKDLIAKSATARIPEIFRYDQLAAKNSLANTIPVFTMYVMKLVLEWVKDQGGAVEMQRRNQRKAKLIYDVIDSEKIYQCPIDENSRSLINVVFTLPTKAQEDAFVDGAEKLGMMNVRGHRSVGGMRLSLYNALPIDAVTKMASYMREFSSAS